MISSQKYIITQYNENQFTLFLKNGSYESKSVLYESIIKTLPHSFSFINPEKQELHFQASQKIINLLDFLKKNRLSCEQCILLIGFLSKQIQELEKRGYTIIGFNLQDILMVDEYVFIFMNNEYLFQIHDRTPMSCITMLIPFQKPYFSSPELLQVTSLPSKLHYKSCYYSLASLVVYCLLEEYMFKGNEVKTDNEIENILKPLYSTKMYWFLKRCFASNPANRLMLFI